MARWSRCLMAGLLAVLLLPVQAKAPDKNDVRVLIDISGSMKQNDPHNLRRPALRMLVGLLQPGTRAGVWTFAKWNNALVPVGSVDAAWKKKALGLSGQIKSPGMFTDIERVMQDAIEGWSGEPTTHNRHLVLLTDGMVDVSKVEGESAASRQRILDALLPDLKRLGVKVHSIALSDRADHELMKRVSGETGGWYQQVQGADQLKRVFLKVFEQVGRPEGVPLEGNRFTVDASVREATILLFREEGSPDPVLISPTGERYTDSDLVAGVAWYRDLGYDLVTVSSPARGEWSLEADVDPDNRVMIVTDLKLETSALPAHLATGERVMLNANLSNKGKVVRRKAFLRLLDLRADAITRDGRDPLGINDEARAGDGEAGDGRYGAEYREQRAFGEVELLFSVESPTFMREKRHLLSVHEPAHLSVEGVGADARAIVKVATAVMAEDPRVDVWQGEGAARKRLTETADGYPLVDPELPVFMKIEGKSRLGNLVSREFGPAYVEGAAPTVVQEPDTVAEPVEPASGAKETGGTTDADAPQETPAEGEAEEDGWMMSALIFGLVNLLLAGIGLGVWWFLRKRRGTDDQISLDDEIESLDAGGEDSSDSAGGGANANHDETVAIGRTEGEAA